MPGAVTNPPFGVQDPTNVRALSAVSPNTRARGSNGSIATLADALLFPGPAPASALSGLWTITNARVSISGVRVINATSQGTAFTVLPPTTAIGPLIISITDPRVTIF
jgi:hypothetical protein